MKTYKEQIRALREAIKYKTHEVKITQDIINQQGDGAMLMLVHSLQAKQGELSALMDACTTIQAFEMMEIDNDAMVSHALNTESLEMVKSLMGALKRTLDKHDPDSTEYEWIGHANEVVLKANRLEPIKELPKMVRLISRTLGGEDEDIELEEFIHHWTGSGVPIMLNQEDIETLRSLEIGEQRLMLYHDGADLLIRRIR